MKRKLSYILLLVVLLSLAIGYSPVQATQTYQIINKPQEVNLTLLDNYPAFDDGVITYDELLVEVSNNKTYQKMSFDDWNLLITQRGINHIDDKLLQEFIDNCPVQLTELYTQLQDAYIKNPSKEQLTQIDSSLVKFNKQKTSLTNSLSNTKNLLKNKLISDKEETKAIVQEAANKVAIVDGKIDEVQKPLQIASQISECERAISVIKEKFACAVKEQELRSKDLVKREYIHSTYYLDNTINSGTITSGATGITFTNGGTADSATATFTTAGATKVVAGDYVKVSNGTQWYKVTTVAATKLTLSPVFQQTTVTDTANATLISCPATHDSRTARDGTTIAKAFCHLNEYTTDTTRTAGDILKVRANQTNVVAGINITFDEAGTVTQYDEIRGCSVADDPFSDSSNVQPIFDFGNTAFNVPMSKNYWRIYNLDITNNNLTSNGIVQTTTTSDIIDTCTIHLNNHASGYAVYIQGAGTILSNCTIHSGGGRNVQVNAMYCVIYSCTINKVSTASYGIALTGGYATISNTIIGATSVHSTSGVYIGSGGKGILWNCTITESTQYTTNDGASFATSEDDGQVLGAQKAYYYSGTITKCASGLTDTTVRAGGGLSSALMMPSSVCTIKYPLNIAYGSLNPDFAVWCPASATTVTVYIRGSAAWGTYPTASQLFIQADYWAGATAIRSQSTASTQVIADGSTWVAFTTTFTPGTAGFAYIKVNLGLYAAGKGIYVDCVPTISH